MSSLSSDDKVRILVLSANPRDTSRLSVGEEFREIDAHIRAASHRDRFELSFLHEVRADELSQALQRVNPAVVHFSGHGSDEGELLMADPLGRARPASTESIVCVFGALSRDLSLRGVLLNACYSDALAIELARHIDCVIGTPSTLQEKAAIAFAGAFYEALAFGRDVETTWRVGCAQIELAASARGSRPALHCRAGVDPTRLRLVEPVVPVSLEAWFRTAFGGPWGRRLGLVLVFLLVLAFLSGFGLHALLTLVGLSGVAWGASLASRRTSRTAFAASRAIAHHASLIVAGVALVMSLVAVHSYHRTAAPRRGPVAVRRSSPPIRSHADASAPAIDASGGDVGVDRVAPVDALRDEAPARVTAPPRTVPRTPPRVARPSICDGGAQRIEELILNGRCATAQTLYRAMRAAGCAPRGADQEFGSACPRP